VNLVPVLLAAALVAVPVPVQPAAPAAPAAPDMAPIECEITDASLTWGFKESFRAYIDGDIANGEWTTDGDVGYETPEFTWSGGTGTYTPIYDSIDIAFSGSVRFTGHDGLLDTTIADPVIRFADGAGAVLLDVSGATMDGTPTDLQDVRFVDVPSFEVVGDDAVRSVDADTALTVDGATAFPNYEAGTAFDPVSISMTVGKECPTAAMIDDAGDSGDAGNTVLLLGFVIGVPVAFAVVVGIVLLTRRRRRA
jgi:hypothetical protein